MKEQLFNREVERNLLALEERLTEALQLSSELETENARLREEQSSAVGECEQLKAENSKKSARIDAMVARLKDLQQPA